MRSVRVCGEQQVVGRTQTGDLLPFERDLVKNLMLIGSFLIDDVR
jgi:hypothetical protein